MNFNVTPEWLAVVGGLIAVWLRLEHRITRLETALFGPKVNGKRDSKD